MIPGNRPMKITKYLPISVPIWIEPKENESFSGIPYRFYTETSQPFIEVISTTTNKLLRTININSIAEIEFADYHL